MKKIPSGERRDKILKAAISLFSQGGFAGTTTRRIARKAGISEALLFRHFPNKERLYDAILQRKMEESNPRILGDLPTDRGPETLLRALARRLVRTHEDDPSFLRLFLFSALEDHKLNDLFFKKRTMAVAGFLVDYFRKAMDAGVLEKSDPETKALAFLAMVFGYIESRIIYKVPQVTKHAAEELMDEYVGVFLHGVLP
ncbi:MAG TPA: TetR/AcrR family transcriptional regulator [bacterium]|nr:TetR/AcrR family transcriptional regulator [bacterium]